MADKDELFKGIDDAANNLFSRYMVKKPEPASVSPPVVEQESGQKLDSKPAPPQAKSAPAMEAKASPKLELEFAKELENKELSSPQKPASPARTPAPGGGEHLFGKLEEALLTIDWEVNHKNIAKGRALLAELVAARGWKPVTALGQVAEQMDKVLASMLEAPESSPVSAPAKLKNAFQAIKEASSKTKTPGVDVRKQLKSAFFDLKALLVSEGDTANKPKQMPIASASSPKPPISPAQQVAEKPAVRPIQQTADRSTFDFGLGVNIEPEDDHSSPTEIVPESTANLLRSYSSIITESIRLITPIVGLFASRPAMASLHSATNQIQARLTVRQNLLGRAFSSNFTLYSGLGTVHGWIESQIDALKGCITRISKLEKIFSKTAGYEKLCTRCTKIRKILTEQVETINAAIGGTTAQHHFDLTGEYPAVLGPATPKAPEAPAAAVSAVSSPEVMVNKCLSLVRTIELGTADNPQNTGAQIRENLEKLKVALSGSAIYSPGATAAANVAASVAGHSTKCRWDWLLKTSWGGQLVGFAPEQVAFESKVSFPVNSFKDTTHFRLKKLKSMPWTNLQNMFTGELAELDKSVLNDMELEIATPPGSFPGSSTKKVYLVILYTGDRGKIYLIDSPTQAISISEEALWVQGTSGQSDIAGTLTVYGSTMPVISID